MKALLADTARIAVVAFAVTSMLSVGLAYRVRAILGPLREERAVFRALVANSCSFRSSLSGSNG